MRDISYRIRHARRKASLSQSALGALLGVNRSAVAQWERPGGCRPTSENMAKLAVVTGVLYEWLATGRGQMTEVDSTGQQHDNRALMLKHFAHDELEERVLLGLRKLEYWQSVVVADMVDGFALGKLRSL